MVSLVYSCGSNGKSQLGNGHQTDLSETECVFESEIDVKKVVCGGNHTLILLTNGDLLAAGDNSQGQCAVGTGTAEITQLTEVRKVGDSKWVNCSAGFEFSVLVNDNNEVYTSGLGPKGELGLGIGVKKSSIEKVQFDWGSKIVDIKSCLDHTVILLENQQVYGFGNGRSGKLGSPPEKNIWAPRLIELEVQALKFEVGRDFTVFSDNKTIVFLGTDKFDIIENVPKEFQDFKTMWSSLHFVTSDHKLKSIGNNSHGQILQHDRTEFDLFEVGSEHGLITKNSDVYSWGWGEHGNCGVNKTNSVTFNYLNLLFSAPPGERIATIKGGCATTWIVTTK